MDEEYDRDENWEAFIVEGTVEVQMKKLRQ